MRCCPKAAFAGSIIAKVLEYWHKQDLRKGWLRDPKFEIDFAPGCHLKSKITAMLSYPSA
jgi:hypothetical protein